MSGEDGGWVLPENIHPPTVCYQIEVPNDPMYIAAFMGTLWQLQYWFNWQRDPTHKGIEVAHVWRALLENIKDCDGNPVNTGYAGADGGGDDLIRQNPDNPCEIQTSADGATWCTFIDLSLCIPAGGQPGNGAELPHDNGGEACYHARMACNSQWLLPYQVSAGDVITVENFGGAGSDAPLGNWTCPNGQAYVLGVCVPGTGGHAGGDPSAAAFHGGLIVSIDGTWYDLTDGPVAVPSGVSSVNAYFQMNDADITNNSGEYTFDVCVTNNQLGTFSHTFDFTTGMHGWNIVNLGTGGEPAGVLVGGSGIEVSDFPRSGGNNRGAAISILLPNRDIRTISYKIDFDLGVVDAPSGFVVEGVALNGVDRVVYYATAPQEGVGITLLGNVTDNAVNDYFFQIRTDATAGAPSGSGKLISVTIEGIGTDPAAGL